MTDLAQRGPMGLKAEKTANKPRKRMSAKSKKRTAQHTSSEGQADLAYMGCVKQLPCVVCGAYGVDAHHCKDLPPMGECGPYDKSPHTHGRSGARDTIPLCPHDCHNGGPLSLHKNRRAWRERNGPDYKFIPATRAKVAAMQSEIDF